MIEPWRIESVDGEVATQAKKWIHKPIDLHSHKENLLEVWNNLAKSRKGTRCSDVALDMK